MSYLVAVAARRLVRPLLVRARVVLEWCVSAVQCGHHVMARLAAMFHRRAAGMAPLTANTGGLRLENVTCKQ